MNEDVLPRTLLALSVGWLFFGGSSTGMAAEKPLPPPAEKEISFTEDIRPILHKRCASCHGGENRKGSFSINSRETLLEGGNTGKAVVVGQSGESLLIRLVAGVDPFRVMPAEGDPLSKKQIGLLRAWIDQGLSWENGFRFGEKSPGSMRLRPRQPEIPVSAEEAGSANPIDRFLYPYFEKHEVEAGPVVSDRLFARRASLDLLGLIPSPKQLQTLRQEHSRKQFVRRLLDGRQDFAAHWLSFWNDALRNAYRGTGFIDGGRKQITGWLYESLYENKPYDEFVRELIDPVDGSRGFLKGIKWRGVVNASQRREMQAAQNISEVFLGTNLKCASCHDSFVNDWKLKDAYALAGIFAKSPLEVHRCDKPTGEFVPPGFIFPQLGTIDPEAPREKRRDQLADLLRHPENGRLTLTIVNRLWGRFFGRGLIEPVNNIDRNAWHRDLLDWLAVDLKEHDYNLKHTMELILTSRAYQMPSVDVADRSGEDSYVFRGPLVRRMTAEQFVDAVSTLTGVWQKATSRMKKRDGRGQGGQLAAIQKRVDSVETNRLRAGLAELDPLMKALGRPNREQVVTSRDSQATMLQALELTNGKTLDGMLKQGAEKWLDRFPDDREQLIRQVYRTALNREPNPEERAIARELVGSSSSGQGVSDLLWSVTMLPEFQLIY